MNMRRISSASKMFRSLTEVMMSGLKSSEPYLYLSKGLKFNWSVSQGHNEQELLHFADRSKLVSY